MQMHDLFTIIYVLEHKRKLEEKNEKELFFRSELKKRKRKKSFKEKTAYLLRLLRSKQEKRNDKYVG